MKSVSKVLLLGALTSCGQGAPSYDDLRARRASGSADQARDLDLVGQGTQGTLCSAPWIYQLETNFLSKPKPYFDNTNVAYAGFGWLAGDFRLKLVGSFPYAQFVSFEVGGGSGGQDPDGAIYDFQMTPSGLNRNPYRSGVPLAATPRNYTLEVRQQGAGASEVNSIAASSNSGLQQLEFRVYAPQQGGTITSADFPKIYAFNAAGTGPAPCPTFFPPMNSALAERSLSFVIGAAALAALPIDPSPTPSFRWTDNSSSAGMNSATAYLTNNNAMAQDGSKVAMLRVKTPTFAHTYAGVGTMPDPSSYQVRHWSVCFGDYQSFYTGGCLPDWYAEQKGLVDANGYVTVVVGPASAAPLAAARHQAFLLDTRPATVAGTPVTSLGFFLRNILPRCSPDPQAATFATTSMYKNEYCPRAVICDLNEYKGSASCALPAAGDCSQEEPTSDEIAAACIQQ